MEQALCIPPFSYNWCFALQFSRALLKLQRFLCSLQFRLVDYCGPCINYRPVTNSTDFVTCISTLEPRFLLWRDQKTCRLRAVSVFLQIQWGNCKRAERKSSAEAARRKKQGCLSPLEPSVTCVVIFVSRAFRLRDLEKREPFRSLENLKLQGKNLEKEQLDQKNGI